MTDAAAGPATAELEIEKVIHGGDGLSRWPGGKAAFVPFTLPGERVRAEREQERPGFVRARAAEILRPAPERIAPGCEYFFRCGGCQMQHASAEAQLRLKEAALRETLARLGGISWPGPIAVHGSPPWGYRNRIRLHWGTEGLGYRLRDSHAVIAVTHCPIASPALNAALAAVAALPAPETAVEIELAADAADAAILAEVRSSRTGGREHRSRQPGDPMSAGGRPLLAVEAQPQRPTGASKIGRLSRFAASLLERIPHCVSAAVGTADARSSAGPVVVAGAGHFSYAVGGRDFRVSHGAFFQVNRFLLAALAAAVVRDAAGQPLAGERAADLFSGVGLFALALADRFPRVSAAEQDPVAAADLRHNASASSGLEVHAMDAGRFLRRWRGPLDLLVVDPPRAGLGTALTAAVAAAAPRRLHYLSCDPATLARDLQQLTAAGFAIASIEMFDLFPQTFHLETLVRLRRA